MATPSIASLRAEFAALRSDALDLARECNHPLAYDGDFTEACLAEIHGEGVDNITPAIWVWAAKEVLASVARYNRQSTDDGYEAPRFNDGEGGDYDT